MKLSKIIILGFIILFSVSALFISHGQGLFGEWMAITAFILLVLGTIVRWKEVLKHKG